MSQDLPPTFKVVTLWLLLGLGVFLGIQWWLHAQQQTRFRSDGGVELYDDVPHGAELAALVCDV